MARRSHLLLTLLAAMVATGALAAEASAQDPDPIEGTWHFGGGQVLVEPTGPSTFKGTVVVATTFDVCTHQTGEQMWEIAKAGTTYSGTHNYFNNNDCLFLPGGRASWVPRQEGASFILDFCSAPPGAGEPTPDNPQRRCQKLDRAAPPAPRGPDTCVSSPGQQICLQAPPDLRTLGCLRRGAFTHRFGVKLKKRSGGGLANRRSRVRIVRFTLDQRPNGSDRRRPYFTNVNGSSLGAGAHVLRANVTLRVPRTGRQFRRNLSYSFNACKA